MLFRSHKAVKDGRIYDLGGRRIPMPGKGIIVVKGKKYVVDKSNQIIR